MPPPKRRVVGPPNQEVTSVPDVTSDAIPFEQYIATLDPPQVESQPEVTLAGESSAEAPSAVSRPWTSEEFEDTINDTLRKVSLSKDDRRLMIETTAFYGDIHENARDEDELNEAAKSAVAKYKETIFDPKKREKLDAFSGQLEEDKESVVKGKESEVESKAVELDDLHFGGVEAGKGLRITEIKSALRSALSNTYDVLKDQLLNGNKEYPDGVAVVIDSSAVDVGSKVTEEVKEWAADRFIHELNFGNGKEEGAQALVLELQNAAGRKGRIARTGGNVVARVTGEDTVSKEEMSKEVVAKKSAAALKKLRDYLDAKYENSTKEEQAIIFEWLEERYPDSFDEAVVDEQFARYIKDLDGALVAATFTEDNLNKIITNEVRPRLKGADLLERGTASPVVPEQARVEAQPQNKYALIPTLTANLPADQKAAFVLEIKKYIDENGDKDALELAATLTDPDDPNRLDFIRQILGL